MEPVNDTYRTIIQPSEETLYKEKGSKFYGYCFPVTTESEVHEHIEKLKKQHHNARHHCYAYQIGVQTMQYRANDDGEPSGTAGLPIYGQIQSFEVTNILVVIVRYFGGTKLGVGGLITAYKESARMALESCEITEKTIDEEFLLTFDYKDMNGVMRIIKEQHIAIKKQEAAENCRMRISVRKNKVAEILRAFEALYEVKISPFEN